MTYQKAFSQVLITTVTAAMLILPPVARAGIVDTQELATRNSTE